MTRPQCAECGAYLPEPECGQHECLVPILRDAIGVELSPAEESTVRWLAGCERESVERIAGLFRRARTLYFDGGKLP